MLTLPIVLRTMYDIGLAAE